MQSLIGRGGHYMFLLLTSSSITRRRRTFDAGLVNVKRRQVLININNNYYTEFGGRGGCCYSTTSISTTTTTGAGGNSNKSKSSRKSLSKKVVIHDEDDDDDSSKSPPVEDKKEKKKKKKDSLFYVVRKGDIVGVYNNLRLVDDDSQVCDLPVSVYKGYNMSMEAEAYLLSRGLKSALYSIRAVDLRQDLFGTLVPCPFQHPHVSIGEPEKMFQQLLGSQTGRACILEFDGACKGNPGISGAGAVLRTPDGTLFCRLREGLGTATNNVAEYRAMILGLRYALSKGFTSICVVGDSKLVCMQIQGLWRVRHPNMIKWYEEAKKLKDEFLFFQINHVLRAKNSAADVQANLAVVLADGEVQEEDVDSTKTDGQSQQSMVLLS